MDGFPARPIRKRRLCSPVMVAVLVAHAVATLAMLGLVWFVQVVHYPMFALVGGDGFRAYSQEHSRRTGWVVGPLMLLEAATALALLVVRPDGVPALAVWLGAALLVGAWALTWWLAVPCHRRLERGFDAVVHRRLVRGNGFRTAAWSLRGAVVAWMLAAAIGVGGG